MARVELPESRLRARKRKRRIRITLIVAGGILGACALLVGASYLPFLQIQAVAVSGAHTISSSTLEAFVQERLVGRYYWMLPKSNMLLYPKQRIAEDLRRSYPVLASVDVHLSPGTVFQTVAVDVVEREPRALWCSGAACYFMDENGVVYGEAPTFSAPVYVSYFGATPGDLPKQFLAPDTFIALSALVDAIAQKLPQEQVSGVTVDANGDVRMGFASGFALQYALKDAGGDIFERFTLALTAEPFTSHPLASFEYLDLRFGDKLYYKLKTE